MGAILFNPWWRRSPRCLPCACSGRGRQDHAALLGIADLEALLGHPVLGASWEGLVVENLIAAAPAGTEAYYYRTSDGAEIDLVPVSASGERWAVEITRSMAPRPGRGFHSACEDLEPARRFVVYPGTEASFPEGGGVRDGRTCT